ncbi:hypothetical protein D3C80_1565600 [compost metagenome]
MPTETKPAFDAEKLVAALDKLAATPNESRVGLKERLKEPRVYEAIQKAKAQKRTIAEIAEAINAAGIEIKAGTLGLYLREIENEMKGASNDRSGAKSANKPPRTTAATSETKQTAPAEKPASKPDDKPAANGGKTLSKSPSMGGAFKTDEL